MKSRLVIAVTGTPGTGKTTFAKQLKKELPSSENIELNDLVEEFKLYSGVDEMGSKIVKIKELESALKKNIEQKEGNLIIVGHLVPELKIKWDIVVVTRLDLKTLIERLEARKYEKEKIRENLTSESIDYCGNKSMEENKNVFEVETDEDKSEIIDYIKKLASGEKATPPKRREIDKISELLDIVMMDDNKYDL